MIERKTNSRMEQMQKFQESLCSLSNERFFDIMRIYLGEIHTPFNKQKLTEQLTGFLLNKENQENILSFLSEFDLKVLSAIYFIKNITQNKLNDFFKDDYKVSDIYSKIYNLTERLLIINVKDEKIDQTVLVINPLLEELLLPFIKLSILVPKGNISEYNYENSFAISSYFVISLLCYIQQYPEMCKNDGSIKKKDLERLQEIFGCKIECIKLLVNSFINLGLIKQGEKKLIIDYAKLKAFSKLQENIQYAYLCSSCATRLSRENLRIHTQIFLDLINYIPEEGLTKNSFIKLAFLIENKISNTKSGIVSQSRFSKMLEASRAESSTKNQEFASTIMDRIFDGAIEYGLLVKKGIDFNGNAIYIKNQLFDNLNANTEIIKAVNINAGTRVTVLPGLSLSNLTDFFIFMDIISFTTVIEFEITKKSVSRAFDFGLSQEDIYSILQKYSLYDIPQSLKINIEEWNNLYNSARIFKGYVLKVSEKNINIVENNPKIKSHIQVKLAEGVYLLDIPLDEEIENISDSWGLNFMADVETAEKKMDTLDFPIVRKNSVSFNLYEKESLPLSEEKEKVLIDKYIKIIDSMELNEQQKESLFNRINRKVILSEKQLNTDSIKPEILEVGGMDYFGKVRLIDNAISSKDMIEIFVTKDNNTTKIISHICVPICVTKQEQEAFVKVLIEPEKEEKYFSVSRISKVKLIKRFM